MKIWVAYNEGGDLVAEADSLAELIREIEYEGYFEDEVIIGEVTP